MPNVATDDLSLAFAALADPTRRAILARLSRGSASVGELAEPFAIGVRAVSKHLAVLERAGLVSQGADAQRRPRRLEAAPLKAVDAWIDQYRTQWEGRLDRIGDVLARLESGEVADD